MPANLPPQFFQLQKKLKETQDIESKIEILTEMLAICPKHKGTERTREELKRKIAKLRKEQKAIKKSQKGFDLYQVKKEGAGQVLILGPPNAGKTSLVNLLTNSSFKVANYPFSTTLPQVAMMPFENIQIQLVDTPPLTKEFCPGWMKNLAQNADLLLIVLDGADNVQKQKSEIEEILTQWALQKKEKIFLINLKNSNFFQDVQVDFSLSIQSASQIEIEKLKKFIFEKLKIVRVYLKKPNKEPDFSKPLILKKGATLYNLLEEFLPLSLPQFKKAKLFKKSSKFPYLVGKDYLLEDEDIIEIK